MKGQIICIISNRYTVLSETGERLVCVAMGKLRKGQSPIVGDLVEFEKYDDLYGIEKLYERKNQLIRPLIANVDQAIIVMSAKDPDFSSTLIDRLLFLICHAHIEPHIVITKMDLLTEKDTDVREAIEDYRKSGYQVTCTTKYDSNPQLHDLFANKVSVLSGQSGAGKSSLVNSLDSSFTLQTQETSKALGRGKHTTRHVELHEVADGWIADTPGFSSLDFGGWSIADLAASVPDFQPYAPFCKFNDCKHLHEPDCSVKKAVEEKRVSLLRYEHYVECTKLCGKVGY